MGSSQFVIFNVGDKEFAIDIDKVSSIEKPLPIFKVPKSPSYIEGLVNLRGTVHAVVNTRKKLGLPSLEFDDNTKFIFINKASSMVGFIVDEIKKITTVNDEDIENINFEEIVSEI